MSTALNEQSADYNPHWVSREAFLIISLCCLVSQILLAVAVTHGWMWLAVPLMLLISHFMHGQLVGFHEASHGLLRKRRFLNDLDGILIGMVSFMSFTLYRVSHQTHHAHLSTERDEELWPFVKTDSPRWSRCLAAFFELNLGLLYTPFLFLRTFLRKNSIVRSPRIRRRIWAEFALCGAFWAVTLTLVAYFGVWKHLLWMYLLPSIIAGNLQSWRKYIEHVGLTGNTSNSSTRSIVPQTWMGRLLAFSLLHEPFHGVHHVRTGLTHAELPGHVDELEPKYPGERQPFQNYAEALWDLLKSLGDPKVGIQWTRATSPVSTEHSAANSSTERGIVGT